MKRNHVILTFRFGLLRLNGTLDSYRTNREGWRLTALLKVLFAAKLLLTVVPSGRAQAQAGGVPPGSYVKGELLVKFRGGPHGQAAEEARRIMKHVVRRNFDQIGWQHVRLPVGMTVEEGLARYRNLPDVLAVEPNGLDRAMGQIPSGHSPTGPDSASGVMPNDPMLAQQWALERIGASSAWGATTGSSNVVVAVMDTGINYNHEDLRENMWHNPGEIPGNRIDDDGNGFVDDVFGIDTADDAFGNDSDPNDEGTPNASFNDYHGTACAGIIGAVGNNGAGLCGVSWSVRLMALRAGKIDGFFSFSDRVDALNYVVLMKSRGVNIRVLSVSVGGANFSQALKEAHEAVASQGILQVTAAGNNHGDNDVTPSYPGNYRASNLLVVAASDASDNLASFSNYGRTNVDLAAPGTSIVTTFGPETNRYDPGFGGTSAACPFVSGAAALLAAANPAAPAAAIKRALLDTVDVLPAFTNKMVSNGRLNLGRAMNHPAIVSNAPPFIASQPRSQTTNEGLTVSFSVTAYGAQPLTYQWQKANVALDGETNASLTLTNLVGEQTGDYTVVVTNAHGAVTSAVARLTVLTGPRLVGPLMPLQISAVPGETLTLGVETTGTLPIGYRWRHIRTNGTSANVTNLVLNQHTCFVTLTIGSNSAGAYTVILTNAAQTSSIVQRTNAILTVLADSDSDGLADAWEAAYPTAANASEDSDGDGSSNLQEYFAGTDPMNAVSYLKFDSISLTNEIAAALLRFFAVSNKTYAVESRDALATGTWTPVAGVMGAATNRVIERFDPLASRQRFYRLRTPVGP